jgi:membrane protein
MRGQFIFSFIAGTLAEWKRDKVPRMAAALAFYTLFSLAPLLVMATAIGGFVYSKQDVHERVMAQVREIMGEAGAEGVERLLDGFKQSSSGIVATVISLLILLLGASRVFQHLQDAFDTIWEVPPRPGLSLWKWVQKRLISFLMVLVTGLLLLTSLVATTFLSAVTTYFKGWLSGWDFLWVGVNFLVAFLITACVFAVIYKFVPRTKVAWKDVWLGAAIATLLFSIGRSLLGLYFGWGMFGSIYGAAGSLVAILLWVYYSSEILLLGAEFTHVYAKRYGSRRPGTPLPADTTYVRAVEAKEDPPETAGPETESQDA